MPDGIGINGVPYFIWHFYFQDQEMDLRVIRFVANLSQQELGKFTTICQSKISSVERGFASLSASEKERLNLFLKMNDIDQDIIAFIEKKRRNGNGIN